MGGDIVPRFVAAARRSVYDFKDNLVPGATDRDRGYWRDVGTIDAYYDAHMDLISAAAGLQPLQPRVADLHRLRPQPPAKFVFKGAPARPRRSSRCSRPARSSPAGQAARSVLSPGVRLDGGSAVCDSVLMDGVRVGPGRRRTQRDPGQGGRVPAGAEIGVDLEHDRARFTVTPSGVRVVEKNQVIVH